MQADGTYSVDVPAELAEGEFTVNASVTDEAGNTATTDTAGEIDTTAPSITIDTRLKDTLKEKTVILPPTTNWRRAGFLAELGLKRFQADDYDNPATLQPLYLRRPTITQAKPLSSSIKKKNQKNPEA